MARPLRIQYPGACYHVMCRGNERRKIFLDNVDRNRFLILLAEREQPSYRGLVTEECDPQMILEQVAEVMEIDRRVLSSRQESGVARGIAAELLYRYSGLTQAEIGGFLGGIDYCSVSQLRSRLKRRMAQDRRIATCYIKAENKVRRSCQM